jgi:hypothetical protein
MDRLIVELAGQAITLPFPVTFGNEVGSNVQVSKLRSSTGLFARSEIQGRFLWTISHQPSLSFPISLFEKGTKRKKEKKNKKTKKEIAIPNNIEVGSSTHTVREFTPVFTGSTFRAIHTGFTASFASGAFIILFIETIGTVTILSNCVISTDVTG